MRFASLAVSAAAKADIEPYPAAFASRTVSDSSSQGSTLTISSSPIAVRSRPPVFTVGRVHDRNATVTRPSLMPSSSTDVRSMAAS